MNNILISKFNPLGPKRPTSLSRGVPTRPIGPLVITKVSSTSIELEWRPPAQGLPVTGYIIEMCESGGDWRKVGYASGHDNDFTVAGLNEGGEYFFRISAENHNGVGPPLQSDCITASQPIAPRRDRQLRYGQLRKEAVTLEWGSEDDEDEDESPTSPITGYLIEKMDFSGQEKWMPVHKV